MELNNNDAAASADSIKAQGATTSGGEIDLYAALVAFAELSPDEQGQLADHREKASAKTETTSDETAEPLPVPEPDPMHSPFEPVAPESAAPETQPKETEGHLPPEPMLSTPPVNLVAAEESADARPRSSEDAWEPVVSEHLLAHPAVERVAPEATASEPEKPSEEAVPPRREIEPVESASETAAPEAVAVAEVATEVAPALAPERQAEPSVVLPPRVEGPRPSGPLSGFNLPPNIVYTGALSRGVCLACGSDSGADDLFCITCGVFMDAIGSSLPVGPTCVECKQVIVADEIFCPWCGAVSPG